jgi:potassium channel subfamily T member 1
MFRLPFARGSVFSANLMDRLLCQAFVKPYLVNILKLLLGIEQAQNTGFLSSVKFIF